MLLTVKKRWPLLVVLSLLVGVFVAAWQHQESKGKIQKVLNNVRQYFNEQAAPYEAWQIAALCFVFTVILVRLYNFVFDHDYTILQRLKIALFSFIRKLPFVGREIQKKVDEACLSVEHSLLVQHPGERCRPTLPSKGLSYTELEEELVILDQMSSVDWKSGRVSGCAYNCSKNLTDVTNLVYGRYTWSNPLHPEVFPQVRKMEAEIVQWCVRLFNGGRKACGVMTSGGTESILMAMKAYRELAYKRGITYPEIIIPVTAHCAFDKAANYFKMRVVKVPVDEVTMQVDLKAMSRAISSSTIVLVGSAPHYPHGIIDPIQQIAQLGVYYDIPVHVDCCLGGFLLPFMGKAGFKLAPFDFRVKGVTSISADTHKFGFAPKGSSVVLYSNRELRSGQFFISTDWPGGVYASPSIAGSRPGGIIAATWAAMLFMGEEGYIDSTHKIISTTRYMLQELNKIHSIFVFGKPQVSVIAVGSRDFNIFRLFDLMTKKGWSLNALQFPAGFHICVTMLHTQPGVADQFLKDIKMAVSEIMKTPNEKATGTAAIYGMAQALPDRSIIADVAQGFIETLYKTTPPM